MHFCPGHIYPFIIVFFKTILAFGGGDRNEISVGMSSKKSQNYLISVYD